MTTINALTISYPDFKLNDVIDPDQFDTNNSQIVGKINEIITQVNSDSSAITGKANKTGADFSGAITAPSITATTSLLLGSTNIGDIYSSWISYTPTITNWTKGNGTVQGFYKQIGKTVYLDVRFILGSTVVPHATLPLVFSLPLPAVRLWGESGNARIYCNSIVYYGRAEITSNVNTISIASEQNASYTRSVSTTATTPDTWQKTTSEYVAFNIVYETA